MQNAHSIECTQTVIPLSPSLLLQEPWGRFGEERAAAAAAALECGAPEICFIVVCRYD